jgi:biopolymer transport protein ExbD/biopolymer transport protein TolR
VTVRSFSDGVRPAINVTPLVDVVLVLLIIFMVVVPRLDQDVQVELPGIFNPDPDIKVSDPVKVTIPQAGEYLLGSERYDLDRLIERLAAEHAADPLRRLVLRADVRLPYGEVRAVFARTQEVGFPGVSLLVGERHRAGTAAAAGESPASPQE